MVQPTKKQKVEGSIICKEEVLFNSDTLSKVISYLPSVDVLNLALTCKRFGVSSNDDDSIIKESARIAVQDIATEEQLAALPHYDGESSLADYHYLQLLRAPLTFDQLVHDTEYVNKDDKTCVKLSDSSDDEYYDWLSTNRRSDWGTAFSNNILRAGKHYVTFEACSLPDSQVRVSVLAGVMRPGQANEDTYLNPLCDDFYQNFSRYMGHGECNNDNNNKVQCCMYYTNNGQCCISDWDGPRLRRRSKGFSRSDWDGMEIMDSNGTIGMLLDLDEGTLCVYKNGRKKGLTGHYCWVVSMNTGTRVTIKRGAIPPS